MCGRNAFIASTCGGERKKLFKDALSNHADIFLSLLYSFNSIFLIAYARLDKCLSMLLRQHASTHFAFAGKVAALRLPFSRNPGRAAGEDLQAPRLLAEQKDGRDRAGAELDDLLFASASLQRIRSESQLLAGLRADRTGL